MLLASICFNAWLENPIVIDLSVYCKITILLIIGHPITAVFACSFQINAEEKGPQSYTVSYTEKHSVII